MHYNYDSFARTEMDPVLLNVLLNTVRRKCERKVFFERF